jgi:hypothetical protein
MLPPLFRKRRERLRLIAAKKRQAANLSRKPKKKAIVKRIPHPLFPGEYL